MFGNNVLIQIKMFLKTVEDTETIIYFLINTAANLKTILTCDFDVLTFGSQNNRDFSCANLW